MGFQPNFFTVLFAIPRITGENWGMGTRNGLH